MARVTDMLSRPFQRVLNPGPTVPVVRLDGAIGSFGVGRRQGLTLDKLAGPLEKAFSHRHAPAVALAVNSPGGAPAQSALIAQRIRELSEEKEKPVFAFIEDVGASGGYWLACAADEIYADASSIVGSIGVIAAFFGFQEFIQRWGVERRLYTTGERKSLLDPFSAAKPEDEERLRHLQTTIHDAFIDHVRKRRGSRLKTGEADLFNGDIWTGVEAEKLGLIDGVGHMRGVLRDRFGDKVRLRAYSAERGLLSKLGLGQGESASRAAAGGVIAAMEERAVWQRFGL